jgi:hypothetical protein
MKRTSIAPLALLVLLALVGVAHAFGLGLGNRFGKLGATTKGAVIQFFVAVSGNNANPGTQALRSFASIYR